MKYSHTYFADSFSLVVRDETVVTPPAGGVSIPLLLIADIPYYAAGGAHLHSLLGFWPVGDLVVFSMLPASGPGRFRAFIK